MLWYIKIKHPLKNVVGTVEARNREYAVAVAEVVRRKVGGENVFSIEPYTLGSEADLSPGRIAELEAQAKDRIARSEKERKAQERVKERPSAVSA